MLITQGDTPVDFHTFRFPGGETHVKLTSTLVPERDVTIMHRIRSGDDVMLLLLTVDALERSGVAPSGVTIVMPYLPYARQDRVMVRGEPFSLKVLARLINGLGVREVRVFDPHSDVGPALLDRCHVVTADAAAASYITATLGQTPFVLVAPDAGAYKKTSRLAAHLGVEVIVATKHRNLADGALAPPTVLGDVRGKTCVIADDICDGGGTFLNLADALRAGGAAECHLFVSHGIFSKGFDALLARFTSIGTTDSFAPAGEYPGTITVINLKA
jgi:ribose-phosphate pyrophosphokinase